MTRTSQQFHKKTSAVFLLVSSSIFNWHWWQHSGKEHPSSCTWIQLGDGPFSFSFLHQKEPQRGTSLAVMEKAFQKINTWLLCCLGLNRLNKHKMVQKDFFWKLQLFGSKIFSLWDKNIFMRKLSCAKNCHKEQMAPGCSNFGRCSSHSFEDGAIFLQWKTRCIRVAAAAAALGLARLTNYQEISGSIMLLLLSLECGTLIAQVLLRVFEKARRGWSSQAV